jgi:hypothetical protein
MRGHGFENRMAKTSNTQTDDFYSACEELRDRIRVMLDVSEEFPVDYVGMTPLPGVAQPGNANVFLDCYQIEFQTANDLFAVVTTAPGEDGE